MVPQELPQFWPLVRQMGLEMLPQVGFGKVVIFFGEYSEGTSTPKLTCYKVEITHVLTLLFELILSFFK